MRTLRRLLVAIGLPLQSELANSLTVEPGSDEPLTTGALSLAGDAGTTVSPDGAPGGVESSTYVTPALHGETLPTASVAWRYTTVVVSSATLIAIPGEANVAAEPDANGWPVQPAVGYSRTVARCSAEPLTIGAFSLAGEAGETASELGTGELESSTYVTPSEHNDVLPAASIASAYIVVVVSSATEKSSPGDANAACVPLVIIRPLQSGVAHSSTRDPASAVPSSVASFAFAGDDGVSTNPAGAAGASSSST